MRSAGQVKGTAAKSQEPIIFDGRTWGKDTLIDVHSIDGKPIISSLDTSEKGLKWTAHYKKIVDSGHRTNIPYAHAGFGPTPFSTAGESKTFKVDIGFLGVQDTGEKDAFGSPVYAAKWGKPMTISASNMKDEQHPVEIRIPVHAGIDEPHKGDDGFMVLYVSPEHARMLQTMQAKGEKLVVRGNPH